MTIKEKVEQYKQLKKSKKTLEKRLQELRDDLLLYYTGTESSKTLDGLQLQTRDLTTFDPYKVADLMVYKQIHPDMFTRLEIDPSKIEQLYLEGTLNDDDLRYIRVPKYSYALIEVGEEDLQSVDDGSS